MDDLVERDGLYYKKFTDVPFTGEVTGSTSGFFELGKLKGLFLRYWENGHLGQKSSFKNGKREGPFVHYHDNGKILHKGTYKDGRRVGPYVRYHKNGQLAEKGTYKNGKREGPWVDYGEDGEKTVGRLFSGTYVDGERVSD
ncbi:MAG: toxin-antitoxin system YwqK family antitoxin [Alphaproteobacteria bacterium]